MSLIYYLRTMNSLTKCTTKGGSVEISAYCRPPIAIGGIGSTRTFSEGLSHMPPITDPDIKNAFKDLMAMSWDDLSDKVISDAKQALSKNTEDKSGQESLTNLLRAAEACEEFGGILISLKMEIDDSVGMSGENVTGVSEEVANALRVVFQRYTTYLGSFGPDEVYLQKKVETELGAKMIYLKMRVSGIGSEWGKVSVLGTSGLSGSYIEQRGP
ncbi:membrane anchor in succinate dehydrogenase complex [Ranunculus cassubicifolius]